MACAGGTPRRPARQSRADARSGTWDSGAMTHEEGAGPVAVLRRWEDLGAVWRVVGRGREGVTVALCRCDGGEEVERLTSDDADLLAHLAGRTSSEDEVPDD